MQWLMMGTIDACEHHEVLVFVKVEFMSIIWNSMMYLKISTHALNVTLCTYSKFSSKLCACENMSDNFCCDVNDISNLIVFTSDIF